MKDRISHAHKILVIVVVIICFIPMLISSVNEMMNVSVLDDSTQSSSFYREMAIASVAIVMPSTIDGLLDVSFTTKHDRAIAVNMIRLTTTEKLMFCLGQALQALPVLNRGNLSSGLGGLTFVCSCSAGSALSICAILIFLCRTGVPMWSVAMTTTSLIMVLIACALFAFMYTNEGLDDQAPAYVLVSLVFAYIIVVCAISVAVLLNKKIHFFVAYSSSSSSPFWVCRRGRRVATEAAASGTDSPDSSRKRRMGDPGINLLLDKYQQIVPIIYMTSTIATLVFTFALFINYGEITSWTGTPMGLWNVKTIMYSILILVLEKRIKQYEIIQGFNALESKRSFVRYISHEVRTPLNTVCLGLDLLKEDLQRDPDDVDTHIDNVHQIQDSCRVAVDILNDLLQYDKLQDHNLQMSFTELPALTTLSTILAPFKIQAKQAGVDLLSTFPSLTSPPNSGRFQSQRVFASDSFMQRVAIYVDKAKIAQVLRNIVTNALKFTPRGGSVTVSARLARRTGHEDIKKDILVEDNIAMNEYHHMLSKWISAAPSTLLQIVGRNRRGSVPGTPTGRSPLGSIINADQRQRQSRRPPKYLIIEVTDSGPGIEKENIGRLFKEVVQFNPNELQGGGGSGLGMLLSRGIVEAHGGSIWLTSEGLGKGCTFAFALPISNISELKKEEGFTNFSQQAFSPRTSLRRSPRPSPSPSLRTAIPKPISHGLVPSGRLPQPQQPLGPHRAEAAPISSPATIAVDVNLETLTTLDFQDYGCSSHRPQDDGCSSHRPHDDGCSSHRPHDDGCSNPTNSPSASLRQRVKKGGIPASRNHNRRYSNGLGGDDDNDSAPGTRRTSQVNLMPHSLHQEHVAGTTGTCTAGGTLPEATRSTTSEPSLRVLVVDDCPKPPHAVPPDDWHEVHLCGGGRRCAGS